jgi:ribosomal protein S18 acetylase RimI-like enzyme
MIIRAASPQLLPAIAMFLARLQAQPIHHIGYLDVTVTGISNYLTHHIGTGWGQKTRLAYDGDVLKGFLMADSSEEIKRVWLHGPLVDSTDAAGWDAVADSLYQEVPLPALALGYEHELFSDAENQALARFAIRHQFTPMIPGAILTLQRHQWRSYDTLPPDPRLFPLSASYRARYLALHAQLFPRSYMSEVQLTIFDPQQTVVFLFIEESQVLGYIYVGVDESGNGHIHYLGVLAWARRRGIGRKLINAGIHWAFAVRRLPRLHLTVNRENNAAIDLYVSLGFTHERTVIGYRKTLTK